MHAERSKAQAAGDGTIRGIWLKSPLHKFPLVFCGEIFRRILENSLKRPKMEEFWSHSRPKGANNLGYLDLFLSPPLFLGVGEQGGGT